MGATIDLLTGMKPSFVVDDAVIVGCSGHLRFVLLPFLSDNKDFLNSVLGGFFLLITES
jgi:hypothetical protein